MSIIPPAAVHENAWGPQGAQGDPGATGPIGPQGAKGDTGDTGAQGPKGETGAAGTDGAPGGPGPQGVKGDKGDNGTNGTSGINGINGTNGAMGATGAQGPAGVAGPGVSFALNRIDADTTIVLPSNGKSVIYLVTTNRTNVNITLPPAATSGGKFLIIKRADRGRIVLIRPSGNDTIEASRAALRLENQRDSITFVSDGTEWVLLSLID